MSAHGIGLLLEISKGPKMRVGNVWRALVVAVGLLSVGSASAEAWHGGLIKSVYPLGNGAFVLIFQVDSSACTSGASSKYMYVVPGENGVDAEGAKKIYAAALLAFAMDKPVSIAFDESSYYCYVNRLSVSH